MSDFQQAPASLELERNVVSCLLQSPVERLGEAVEALPGPEAFYFPATRVLYETMLAMSVAGAPVDLVTVTQRLVDRGEIERVGGPAEVVSIFTCAGTEAHFAHYLGMMMDKFLLRKLIDACLKSTQAAYAEQDEVSAVIDRAEAAVLGVRDLKKASGVVAMRAAVLDAVGAVEEFYRTRGKTIGVSTGFAGLDAKTHGLKPGEMMVIAARPSMGKTALALNIIDAVALAGTPVVFFSLEMPCQQVTLRLLCTRMNVEMSRLQGGFLANKELTRLNQVASALAKTPVFIDDSPSLTVLELRAKARRLRKQEGVGLVVVDYLQLMRSTSKKAALDRQVEVAEISNGLKALAKELSIPVLVLAQLNRGPEARGGRPRLSDLRESGAIEQDADVVGLLYREKYYAEDVEAQEAAEGKAELIIAKNRNGATGEVPLVFLEGVMRFADRAEEAR